MQFKDKVVVVTGGASGIGAACCKKISALGGTIISLDIKENLNKYYANKSYAVDLTQEIAVKETFDDIYNLYGKIDILINSCGVIHRAAITETDYESWNKIIAINLNSVFLTSKNVIPSMIENGGGCIVNVSSGWGLSGGAKASAYCASKGAVVLLTKAMALDYGNKNIRVNCVCPGDIDTPLLQQEADIVGSTIEDFREAGTARPLGRIGQPSEIADAIAYLASEEASFITGTAIPIDGGALAGTN